MGKTNGVVLLYPTDNVVNNNHYLSARSSQIITYLVVGVTNSDPQRSNSFKKRIILENLKLAVEHFDYS